MQRPTPFLGELASAICQRDAAGIDQNPPALHCDRNGVVRGAIDPANCSPLHLLPVGRLIQQAYECQGHGFGVVWHGRPEAGVERQQRAEAASQADWRKDCEALRLGWQWLNGKSVADAIEMRTPAARGVIKIVEIEKAA